MKINMRMPPATIVVLGTGVIAHAAAVALRRALPASEVTLASSTASDGLADDASLLLPSGLGVLTRLGLDEETLVAAGCASHRLCERFDGWGAGTFVADPTDKPRLAGAALHQLWLLHRNMPFQALSAAASMATAGRFAPGPPVESALALDAEGLLRLLFDSARRLGVRFAEAVAVSEPQQTPATVSFADGRSLHPDLLIDAGAQPMAGDVRTFVAHRRPLAADTVLYDSYRKTPDGWHAHWCGPTGGTEIIFSGSGDDSGLALGDDWLRVQYPVRRTGAPLSGNRLLLSTTPGPFLRLGLTLSLRMLALLLELVPGREPEPLLASEFNRRARLMIDAGFDICEAIDPRSRSARVEALVGAFERQGRLPPGAGQLVGSSYWHSLLIGLGTGTDLPDALAVSVPTTEARAALQAMRRAVAAAPAGMPVYARWLTSARGRTAR